MRARVRAGVCVVVCAQCVPLGLLEIEMDLGVGVVVGAVVAVVVVVVALGGRAGRGAEAAHGYKGSPAGPILPRSTPLANAGQRARPQVLDRGAGHLWKKGRLVDAIFQRKGRLVDKTARKVAKHRPRPQGFPFGLFSLANA